MDNRTTSPGISTHRVASSRGSRTDFRSGAEHYRPAGGQDPETAELRHRGPGHRGELRAMIVIDIFKENHRFSEKTPHPGPRSVVGAANLAASGGR